MNLKVRRKTQTRHIRVETKVVIYGASSRDSMKNSQNVGDILKNELRWKIDLN